MFFLLSETAENIGGEVPSDCISSSQFPEKRENSEDDFITLTLPGTYPKPLTENIRLSKDGLLLFSSSKRQYSI